MERRIYASTLAEMVHRRNVRMATALAMVIANVLLSCKVLTTSTQEKTIVTPPVIEKAFWVQGAHVAPEYLEMMATFFAGLALSYSNNTLRLPCPVLYTQTIVVGDPVAAAGAAKLRSARATQMTDTPMGKFVPAWRERKKDWDFVIRSLEEGHKLLQGHFQIVLFAPLGQEEYCEQRMRAVFESRGWQLAKDRFSVLHSFLAALPMNTGPAFIGELKKLRFFRSMLTWSCINTAPVIGEWKGTGSPLLLLLGRRGQVQFVDPFDNTKGNFNIACAATSGAGKSFFTQELATSVMGTGGRVSTQTWRRCAIWSRISAPGRRGPRLLTLLSLASSLLIPGFPGTKQGFC